jgi:hypothetical protein
MKTGSKDFYVNGRTSFFSFLVKACVTLTFDLKINRGYLIIMTNLHAIYENSASKNIKLLGEKSFF